MYAMSAQHAEIKLEPYIPVAIDKLIVGTSLPFNVFIKDPSFVIPLFNKGAVYDGFALNILRDKGIGTVQVKTSEGADLENYLSRNTEQKKTLPDPETFKLYVATKNEFYLIDRNLLIPGKKISFSLFTLNEFRVKVLLPATEQLPAAIDEHVAKAMGDILIMPADIPRYHAYLDSLLAPGERALPEQKKIKSIAMKENSKLILKDLLDNPRSGEKIRESITLVNNMVDHILGNKGAVYDLLSLRTHDYYTYTHSVNVAVLSVGLGMALGMAKEEIRMLGIGAMLHDVGKSAVPSTIINKAGRLDDDEYRIIQTHPTEGEKILCLNRDIPRESLIAVSQHHERLSGRGYPNNKAGQELQPFGRITAIVDCYDALTTTRSYQAARTPFMALSIITKDAGDYDADILQIFIKMLGTMKA
jgi:HD-GYP domain-containing protein (c-di-GMP phosphodiesterase class II)